LIDGDDKTVRQLHPGTAGRGIGRLLMRHIEALAVIDGYDHMETGASITAHDFYRRLGYIDVRSTETEFGLNYILRRDLP
jgi:GNAT superfamily N-acetyltransferase